MIIQYFGWYAELQDKVIIKVNWCCFCCRIFFGYAFVQQLQCLLVRIHIKVLYVPRCRRGVVVITTAPNSSIKAWTQVLRRFKSCSWRVGDSRWWGSLTMVPAENKAMPFVGQPYHKTIHHIHVQFSLHCFFISVRVNYFMVGSTFSAQQVIFINW